MSISLVYNTGNYYYRGGGELLSLRGGEYWVGGSVDPGFCNRPPLSHFWLFWFLVKKQAMLKRVLYHSRYEVPSMPFYPPYKELRLINFSPHSQTLWGT